MIADIAKDESDLVEIGQMIDRLGWVRRGRAGRLDEGRHRHDGASELKQIASAHRFLHGSLRRF
jgi:hypothetical protein